MIICSYYTQGTEYEQEAIKLIKSCEALNLKYHVESKPNRFSWDLNTKYKPAVILHCMSQYKEDVLFVDADATFHHEPNKKLFYGDVAAHVMDKAYWGQDTSKRNFSLMSGTLWFPNNPRSKDLLIAWERENAKHPAVWDQKNLETALKFDPEDGKCYGEWTLCSLPHAYCVIDKTMPNVEYAVIRHHQASRRLKNKI